MRLDELTKSEIAEFKKADCFYAIIEPAQNQYEVVKLTKDEVEFDEYRSNLVVDVAFRSLC